MAQKTTLSLMGIPGGVYGSFAGKVAITPPPVVEVAVGEAVVELRLFSPDGVEFARISDFDWLTCALRVNTPGVLECQLRGNHRALTNLVHRSQVEVWRKDPPNGIAWYRHMSGVYVDQDRALFKVPTLLMRAAGDLWRLGARIVNYPANTLDRSKFLNDPAETIAKGLVTYNVTASATTGNGRKRNGTNWPATGVSVETDEGRGEVLNWYCHGDNVLSSLQELALVGGGDFDLVKTGLNAFEFRWYPGQLGTDRSTQVYFGLARDNMGDPRYRFDRWNEGTVAAVWGQGEEANRDYVTRTGPDYSTDNDLEFYVAATDVELGNTSGLNAAGDRALEEKRAREAFSFVARQTRNTIYKVHYDLGDLVGVVNPFTGASSVAKVMGVRMVFERGKPLQFETELANYV